MKPRKETCLHGIRPKQMKEYIKNLISELCAPFTVTGFEKFGHESLIRTLSPLFDETECTNTQNLYFIRRASSDSARTLLIDAHCDEIGFMVSGICERGFLHFVPLGGIDTRILAGAEVEIYGKSRFKGIITSRAPHLMSAEERTKNPDVAHLFIDTGKSREWLFENAPIGTPVGFSIPVTELKNGRIAAKGLDNKACVAAAATAVKLLCGIPINVNIILMLSSREETGSMGAVTGAFKLRPDMALVLDVNLAYTPTGGADEAALRRRTVELGSGAAISMSAVTDRRLTQTLIGIAEAKSIMHQLIVEADGTGTNADRMALVASGIPCAVVSVPLKNMHTYSETVCTEDIENTARLICEYIKSL